MTAPAPYYADELVTLHNADVFDLLDHLDPDELGTLVTDPPYGMNLGRRGLGAETFQGVTVAGDRDTDVRDRLLGWWGTDRPALVFGTWKAPPPPGVREVLVWDKGVSTGAGDLSVPWRPSWEAIYVIGGGDRWQGPRGHGVLRYVLPTKAPDRKWHPTPKPVDLLRALIAKAPPGPIFDPFAGAGSTLRAAKDLGRRVIGVELEETYCARAVERLAQEVLPW